ncbi:hypothetical protein LshimejAT787_0111360 [Lyophyllum shimeji]|uniref:Uncharacterized protein n=1 Tax=Lyophyllum shimeji TaxID=47721 RepID=A0A9P3PE60_LYOSH|nr:hypothetical protein LshimejAT787_0111360 [Lyophyllum shimeji]
MELLMYDSLLSPMLSNGTGHLLCMYTPPVTTDVPTLLSITLLTFSGFPLTSFKRASKRTGRRFVSPASIRMKNSHPPVSGVTEPPGYLDICDTPRCAAWPILDVSLSDYWRSRSQRTPPS